MLVYVRPSDEAADSPSKLARTFPQGGGLDLSLTARIDRGPFDWFSPLCPKGSSQTVLHCAH